MKCSKCAWCKDGKCRPPFQQGVFSLNYNKPVLLKRKDGTLVNFYPCEFFLRPSIGRLIESNTSISCFDCVHYENVRGHDVCCERLALAKYDYNIEVYIYKTEWTVNEIDLFGYGLCLDYEPKSIV